MKSQDETLEDWCRALLQALELEGVEIDVSEVLALAGVAAHSVVRPAAPLTTFIAGYAAGLASRPGQACLGGWPSPCLHARLRERNARRLRCGEGGGLQPIRCGLGPVPA